MTSILDKFKRPLAGFVAQTPRDLFALRLAQKLNDAAAVGHYAMLAAEHSEAKLLNAYRHTLRSTPGGDLGRRFHVELQRASDQSSGLQCVKLIAVRVERRAIAAAIFNGTHLEYTQVRQLSSTSDKALASATDFVRWLLKTFPIESAAMEAVDQGQEIRRNLLTDAITQTLRDRMLPIWQIPKEQLFECCGYPALTSRKQLRELITAIWPVLGGSSGKVFIHDAAALGLYVQTERLFIIN